MELTLNKWGNSKGIRLGSKILEQLGDREIERFSAEVTSDKRLILTPIAPDDNGSLSYLFRDYEDDNIREPLVDFGENVGCERL